MIFLGLLLALSSSWDFSNGQGEKYGDRPSLAGFDLVDLVPGEPFSPKDYQNAQEMINFSPPAGGKDPIELAGLYEGDIILTNLDQIKPSKEGDRNAIAGESKRWINGVIPYMIHSSFSAQERGVIAKAFLEYHNKTCITFRPRTSEKDYIFVVKGRGCSSPVGRQGGAQAVTLGDGCVYPGIAIHELMHAVGFWHEQSREERDEHVTIYFNNIATGMDFNFKKLENLQNQSVGYDTNSILHYGPYAFAKDKRYPTIVPKIPNKNMGQREGFSEKDIMKIRRLYNCNGEADKLKSTTPTSTTATTPAPDTVADPATVAPAIPGPSLTTPVAGTHETCEDNHRNCGQWSSQGECKKSSKWMMVNCRKSCDRCDSPCSDLNTYCGQWAAAGECSKNPEYMSSYCAKSCYTCESESSGSSSSFRPSSKPECEDKAAHCSAWAMSGECQGNPKWMLQNCPKSCNACPQDVELALASAVGME